MGGSLANSDVLEGPGASSRSLEIQEHVTGTPALLCVEPGKQQIGRPCGYLTGLYQAPRSPEFPPLEGELLPPVGHEPGWPQAQ